MGFTDLFKEIRNFISINGYTKPTVSSSVLQIMKLTMLITLLCCVMVAARQYIGQNINCLTAKDINKAVESYCFISGTFTVPDLVEKDFAHPGVGPIPINVGPNPRKDETGQVTLHAYYQWVPLVLLLQGLIYYLPLIIWKQIDKGYFETTICKLNEVHIEEEDVKLHLMASAAYMAKTLTQHRRYAILFLIVESLSVIITIANLFLTNAFLGGEFFSYGPNAVRYLQSPAYDYNNPLNQVFPKMAKCTWHKYGSSGTIETHDTLCVLPLNIVNEKTYIVLWFAYIITAIVVSLLFAYHLILFLLPSVRNSYLLKHPMKTKTRDLLENILKKGNVGDWFLILNYKSQMMYFRDWVKQVHDIGEALLAQRNEVRESERRKLL